MSYKVKVEAVASTEHNTVEVEPVNVVYVVYNGDGAD